MLTVFNASLTLRNALEGNLLFLFGEPGHSSWRVWQENPL